MSRRTDAIAPAVLDANRPPPPLAASRLAVALVAAPIAFALAVVLSRGEVVPVALVWFADGAVALLWLLAAWGAGDAISRAIGLSAGGDEGDRALRHVTAVALGLGTGSLATLLLGWAGLVGGIVAWPLVLIGAALAVRRLRTDKARTLAYLGERAGSAWLLLLVVPMLAIAGVAACVPPGFLWGDEPAGYDVVAYHLQLPREWYELGRVVPLGHNVFSFFPLNVEMHALLAFGLRGGPYAGMYLAQLMCGAFTALSAAAAYGAVRRRGRTAAALAAVATFAFPWSGMLAGIAYNEGGLMLWATLAAAWALRGRWLAAGVCAGLAAGAKYTGVTSAVILVPIVVGIATAFRGTGFQPVSAGERPREIGLAARAAKGLTLFAIGVLVTFGPWLIRNAIYAHGNPVFPLALKTLGYGGFDAGQVERFEVAHAARPDQQSLAGRGAALRDQVLTDWRYGAIGIVPVLLLLTILPAPIARPRDREAWAWLGLIVGNVSVWLFATHLQGRFLTQAIPAASILAGLAWRGWRAGAVAAAVFVVACAAYVEPLGRVTNPVLRQAFGVTDLRGIWDDDVRRAMDDERATLFLVGDERPFMLPVPTARLRYRSVFDVPSNVGFRAAWLGADVPDDAWAVVTPSELERFAKTYRNLPPVPAAWRGRGGTFVVRARDVPNE